jgi:hypothetical protein
VLRQAEREEWLRETGTRVRVWLKRAPGRKGGLLNSRNNAEQTLESLCIHMFPALSVNLKIKDGVADEKQIVSADDWITMKPEELRKRIDRFSEGRFREKDSGDPINENMRLLKDAAGEIIGRACADPYGGSKRGGESGVITVGGIRANRFRMIIGVMVGTSVRATRDTAIPVVSSDELARWATEQAQLAVRTRMMDEERSELADFICACGGDTGDLPIGWGANGPMTIGEVKDWARPLAEIMLSSDYELRSSARGRKELQLQPKVLIINNGSYLYYLIDDGFSESLWPDSGSMGMLKGTPIRENTVKARIIKTLAEAWGATVEDVLSASSEEREKKQIVGTKSDKELKADVEIIKRPEP